MPKGANLAATPDLDLDGDRDQLWLADSGNTRLVGVRTATGAVFSSAYTSASPIAVRAVANRLADASIILVDNGRSVQLFAVVNCRIVPSKNAQGKQYTFDRGFTGYGTGVGCPTIGGSPVLVGFLAQQQKDETFRITRTTIDLSDYGRKAANGEATVVATGERSGTTLQKAATSVSCGPNNPAVNEPG